MSKESCSKHEQHEETCIGCIVANHVEENKEAYRTMGEN